MKICLSKLSNNSSLREQISVENLEIFWMSTNYNGRAGHFCDYSKGDILAVC